MIQIPSPVPGDSLGARLEAALFCATDSLATRRLAELLGAEAQAVEEELGRLRERYAGPERGVHLVEISGGWRMLTNPQYADAVAALRGRPDKERLSPAALETLAIIAYKQPTSRAEIERIRGVAVGPVLRHLLDLELVRVTGREDGLGRALLYGTTRVFLDRFGLKDAKELPASLEI